MPKDVLEVIEIDKPVPKEGEVLLRVNAASVNAADWRTVQSKPFFARVFTGLFSPKNKVLGGDIAGTIEALGKGVSQFKVGDEVYGCLVDSGAGGFAEYVCAKETVLTPKPSELSFEEAAALPLAAVTALQGLRDIGQVKKGQKVLINGASGGVGIFSVQIAKAFDAEVTAVCSTKAIETIKPLADYVVDYKIENCFDNGVQYDVILDIASAHKVKQYRRSLSPNGTYVAVGFSGSPTIGHMLSIGLAKERDGKKVKMLEAKNDSQSDLLFLNKLVEKGKLKAIIDSRYSLNEIVAAMEHLENGHPVGKVVIVIDAKNSLGKS